MPAPVRLGTILSQVPAEFFAEFCTPQSFGAAAGANKQLTAWVERELRIWLLAWLDEQDSAAALAEIEAEIAARRAGSREPWHSPQR